MANTTNLMPTLNLTYNNQYWFDQYGRPVENDKEVLIQFFGTPFLIPGLVTNGYSKDWYGQYEVVVRPIFVRRTDYSVDSIYESESIRLIPETQLTISAPV